MNAGRAVMARRESYIDYIEDKAPSSNKKMQL